MRIKDSDEKPILNMEFRNNPDPLLQTASFEHPSADTSKNAAHAEELSYMTTAVAFRIRAPGRRGT